MRNIKSPGRWYFWETAERVCEQFRGGCGLKLRSLCARPTGESATDIQVLLFTVFQGRILPISNLSLMLHPSPPGREVRGGQKLIKINFCLAMTPVRVGRATRWEQLHL